MATKLSGFPELLPRERIVEQQVLDHLRRTFELHGFANIETRAVEPLDVLLRKGEIDKEVYAVKRLAAGDSEPAELALHYDLTVPFARYVLENAGKLEFPFRRWQIQKVWRGERPQQGRFREFTQADIDIVARDMLPFHFDVEVARVMAEALAGLPIPTPTLQISNRKILEGFYLGLGVAEPLAVMPVVDKLDKVPAERIHELLVEQGLDAGQADRILALAEIVTTDTSFVPRVEALGVEHELLAEGLSELAQVVEGASGVEGVVVTADLRIARGLDYYTGTVFETRLEGWEHLGSICSGGRYDKLAQDRRSTYPGVGISLGVSRLLVPLALGVQVGAVGRAGGRRLRGDPRRQQRGRRAPAGARHPHRGRGQGRPARQADPERREARHPVRLVPPGSGQGHPHRRPGRRGPGPVGPPSSRPHP
jgi:histidyl-tRNA synthetase